MMIHEDVDDERTLEEEETLEESDITEELDDLQKVCQVLERASCPVTCLKLCITIVKLNVIVTVCSMLAVLYFVRAV